MNVYDWQLAKPVGIYSRSLTTGAGTYIAELGTRSLFPGSLSAHFISMDRSPLISFPWIALHSFHFHGSLSL